MVQKNDSEIVVKRCLRKKDGYLFDEELVLLSEDGANITDRNYPVCFLASGKYRDYNQMRMCFELKME